GLSEWFVRNAALEYGLDNIFTESIRKDLAKAPKPRRKLKELPRSACNKILIKAAQFARPQHTSANIQESKSTFSSLLSQILRFGIAKSVSVAKRILGMDRCHKIRAALNDSLLSSFSSMTTSAPKSWAKISEEDHGLNVIGYLGAESGMGESARSTIRAAAAAGIPLSAINFTHGCSSRKQEPMPLDHYNTSRHSVNVAHVNADQTPTLLRTLGPHFFSARYNIGYWVWETTEFPSEFLRSFECYDEIWTASEFCRDVIMRKSPKPVMKIPHSINLNPNLNISRSSLGLPEGAFLFLTMADFLSVPERKNPLGAIDAFVKAFGPDPKDVGLVVKISNSWYHPEIRKNILEKTTNSRSIVVIDDYMDRSSVTALISVTDCYVSLHRSEGFGLPIAEAMSLGKPVVATGWSGNMEFMDSTNSFPVKHDLVEISLKDGPYKNAGCWAEPDCNHAAELMSYVVGNQQHAQAVGSLAKARMANEYSIDAIGGLIKDRLTWIRESMN
ncbi:MAG: glycosyltransferase family 4 protein, partial [Desulfomonilaceae bacterium]